MQKILRTIDPLKGLKGKLNYLKYQNQPILQIYKLANSLGCSSNQQKNNEKSSLQNISIDDINQLKSTSTFTNYDHKKMLFEAHVHKNANHNLPTTTIYQQLDKHQKRLVLSLLKFADKLNIRQMSYLQYTIRNKINSLYPNWNNLHFNPQSPLRKQFVIMPTLSTIQHLYQLKLLPKKKVTAAIAATRKVVEQKKPEQSKQAAKPATGAGKPQKGQKPEKGKGKGK